MSKRFWMTTLAALAVMGGCAWGAAENTVTIPNSTVKIESRAFQGNTSLETVIIPNPATEVAPDAFEGCSENLRVISVPGSQAWNDTEKYFDLDQSDFRALVIGLSYEGSDYTSILDGNGEPYLKELQGTINDADSMEAFLKADLLQKKYQVTRCKDKSERKDVISAIHTAFRDATPDDVSLFYFAGHMSSDGRLICQDYSPRTLAGTIMSKTLKEELDKIPGRKVLVVDACYSGLLIAEAGQDDESGVTGRGTEYALSIVNAFLAPFHENDEISSRSAEFSGTNEYYVLVAASTTEKSSENYIMQGSSKKNGYFTYYLAEGLGWNTNTNEPYGTVEADSDNDKLVTLKEIGSYTKQRVIEMKRTGTKQTAQYYPTNDPHPFAVFRYTDD